MAGETIVSVIIIFLDEARFLREAVESVFSQTSKAWELLLVDDGSKDGSSNIAKEFEARHPDCARYFEHEGHQNLGMSATRNLGIRNSRGRYIAFLDADDVWEPNKLADQLAIAGSHPEAGMICGASQYWSSWDDAAERQDYIVPVGARSTGVIPPPALAKELYPLGEGAAPCPSSLMIRRDLALNVGGFEEQFRGEAQLYEDQAFLVKVYLISSVYVSSSCWLKYRQHADSCVTRVHEAGQYDAVRLYFLRWLKEYVTADSSVGRAERRLVQRALLSARYPSLRRSMEAIWSAPRAVTSRVARFSGRIHSKALKVVRSVRRP